MTQFDDINNHPGNRDFERVNALVCIGWQQTSSAKIVNEPSAEMNISSDNSHIWCNWVAGGLCSEIYEFYGNGEVRTRSSDKRTDVSKLAGGIELALDTIGQMVDIDEGDLLEKIIEQLKARRESGT
jgi:hypothetical protein